ncbi:hypothetical protein L6452_38551 [Arctium lappa]|uniref:Uncharacterized protein n=1 Tax=Arctium lappa TaxID=4217 RepID=A0ACB8XPV0_ARCLA|nr:hypothetical protein L6452_38551 [Arctium lappa]
MKGITVFTTSDVVFTAHGLPNLNKLTNAEVVSLLLYHASSNYISRGSLKTVKNPIHTLATNTVGKFNLIVQTNRDFITFVSRVDSSHVKSTALDSVPISIFKIENVLLPNELFTKSLPPTPSPTPETSTRSTPSPVAFSPSSIASSLAPVNGTSLIRSPTIRPTPSISSPIDGSAPAENPTVDTGNSNASNDGDISKFQFSS